MEIMEKPKVTKSNCPLSVSSMQIIFPIHRFLNLRARNLNFVLISVPEVVLEDLQNSCKDV